MSTSSERQHYQGRLMVDVGKEDGERNKKTVKVSSSFANHNGTPR
jgi:hypothetical protein